MAKKNPPDPDKDKETKKPKTTTEKKKKTKKEKPRVCSGCGDVLQAWELTNKCINCQS